MTSFQRKGLEASKKRKSIKGDYSQTEKSYGAVNSQCLKKKTYATMRLAERVAVEASIKRAGTIRSYECNLCGFYHLTKRTHYKRENI